MNNYISSIINKYGDTSQVEQDMKTLIDIQMRQGSALLIDLIAESAGRTANQLKLSDADRKRLVESMCKDLRDAMLERL